MTDCAHKNQRILGWGTKRAPPRAASAPQSIVAAYRARLAYASAQAAANDAATLAKAQPTAPNQADATAKAAAAADLKKTALELTAVAGSPPAAMPQGPPLPVSLRECADCGTRFAADVTPEQKAAEQAADAAAVSAREPAAPAPEVRAPKAQVASVSPALAAVLKAAEDEKVAIAAKIKAATSTSSAS